MKIRESWLQNGIFSYKQGISVTKRDSWIINGILGLLFTLQDIFNGLIDRNTHKNKPPVIW